MGVLARLFRRSRATEEAVADTAAEAATDTGTAAGADAVTGEVTTAPGEAPSGTPADGEAAAGTAGTPAADGVEIPRQQSAGDVADSEAGEGAHT
ncbi:hypothetical protein ACFY30_29235 [Streptomyces sp. NPDC000345]|uniref:hypothetical protein n=1 Tax=Streptomyces sp. NPDC000345 TaxID=3364537 RepID=UPI0036829A25